MNRLTERETQAKQVTREERESGATDNPLINAEAYPNRFRTLSYFFEDEEGVEIVQDLDWENDDPKVYYFWQGGREEITEGALYDWAIERWESD